MSAPTANETKGNDSKMEVEETLGLDADDDRDIVVLVGPTKEQFKVKRTVLVGMSEVAKTALEMDPSATEFPCAGVSPAVFKVILDYMNYHKGKPGQIPQSPAKSKLMKENCTDPWDAEFFDKLWDDLPNRMLFYNITLAANQLNISCLLHLCACKVGSAIQGTPHEKIRELLMPPQMFQSQPQETA